MDTSRTARTYSDRDVPKLLTAREVAKALALSVRTVRRLAASGALTAVKLGESVRFRVEDVNAFVAHGRTTINGEGPAGRPTPRTTPAGGVGRDGSG